MTHRQQQQIHRQAKQDHEIERTYSPAERLIIGTRRSDIKMVQSALDEGADIDAPARQRVKADAKPGAAVLLEYNRELGNEEWPLLIAVKKNDSEMAQFLLSKNVNTNMCTARYAPALHSVSTREMAALLLENNADINTSHATFKKTAVYNIIHSIARFDCYSQFDKAKMIEAALYLIEMGADLNEDNLKYEPHERTLTVLAIKINDMRILKALIAKGLDINKWRGKKGETLLHHAAESSNSLEMILFLLENGIAAAATDHKGLTALSWCPKESSCFLADEKEEMEKHEESVQHKIRHRLAHAQETTEATPVTLISENAVARSRFAPHQSLSLQTDIVPYTNTRNDYEFIKKIMEGNVQPLKTFSAFRGAHRIKDNSPNFFIPYCCSDTEVMITGSKQLYYLCANFWYYLIRGYHPKKADAMRNYHMLGDGFFYVRKKDYRHISDTNAGWPINYEDGTVIYRSDLFATCLRLFPDTFAQYVSLSGATSHKNTRIAEHQRRASLQALEIYLYLLEKEHPDLSRKQIAETFKNKIADLPEIILLPEAKIIKKGILRKKNSSHCHHLRDHLTSFIRTVDEKGETIYISNVMKRRSHSQPWFKNGEMQEAYLILLNKARERQQPPLPPLNSDDILHGLHVKLDIANEQAQISILEKDYEGLLLPCLARDIRENVAEHARQARIMYPVLNPYHQEEEKLKMQQEDDAARKIRYNAKIRSKLSLWQQPKPGPLSEDVLAELNERFIRFMEHKH